MIKINTDNKEYYLDFENRATKYSWGAKKNL